MGEHEQPGKAGPGPSVRCARCWRPVGLVWYLGHSTLIDPPITADAAGRLTMAVHRCPEPPKSPSQVDLPWRRKQGTGAYPERPE